jgi:hypothetical protein
MLKDYLKKYRKLYKTAKNNKGHVYIHSNICKIYCFSDYDKILKVKFTDTRTCKYTYNKYKSYCLAREENIILLPEENLSSLAGMLDIELD